MLRVGIIGFGFMGRMHFRCWKALAGAAVTAVCDADPHAFDDAAQSRGNIAGAEGDVDLAGVRIYSDFAQLIRQEPLDAVSITVPTHLHAKATTAALDAGWHVLCEKPMALNLAEGTRMIDAARRSGKVLQIGHCIRFWPEYAKAKEIVDRGAYGRVIAATFQRLSATAARKRQTWYANAEQSGGMPLDLHIHDTDFIQYLFGMPRTVCSHGATTATGGLAHIVTHYGYGDDRLVIAEGGWAMMPPFGFQMRFHIALETATLDFDFQRDPKLRLATAAGAVVAPQCEPGDGYSRQIAHFARRIEATRQSGPHTPTKVPSPRYSGERVRERGSHVPGRSPIMMSPCAETGTQSVPPTIEQDIPPVITPEEAWNSLRIIEAERESACIGRAVTIDSLTTQECCHAV